MDQLERGRNYLYRPEEKKFQEVSSKIPSSPYVFTTSDLVLQTQDLEIINNHPYELSIYRTKSVHFSSLTNKP